jgi:hypothetical protein
VADGTLLTAAHVVATGERFRIAWFGGDKPVVAPVRVVSRHPDVAPPDGPYPMPDVAVLEVEGDIGRHPVVWLDTGEPGAAVAAFGYTDEYREGVALGHPVSFDNAGLGYEADDPNARVWRLKADRIRGGMSGAPLFDLASGRVVGIVKRTQDAEQSIGGWATGMDLVREAIPDIVDDNHARNATPERDEEMAEALWGTLVLTVATPLEGRPAVRESLAKELGIPPGELSPDDTAASRRVARGLFAADLDVVVDCVTILARTVGPDEARRVFDAVATCTSYQGEHWVAAAVAGELAAQVDLFAAGKPESGRVLHLRSGLPALRPLYLTRGDRQRSWWRPLTSIPFDHNEDEAAGLPADVERELRIGIARRFPQVDAGLCAAELDEQARKAWEEHRPRFVKLLRQRGVVGLLSPTRLDANLVDALAEHYPLVFLLALPDDVGPEVRKRPAYQALDPGVDDDIAGEALFLYETTCSELSPEQETR